MEVFWTRALTLQPANKMVGIIRAVVINICFVVLIPQICKGCPSPCRCSGTIVDCSNRKLSEIPAGVPFNVSTLKLQDNALTHLPDDAFRNFTELQHLYLYGNRIEGISREAFSGLEHLNTLDIHGNMLETVPHGVFVPSHSLIDLYLHSNRIDNISSESFRDLSSLVTLDLHDNRINTIQDDLFDELASLKYLYLNDNLLASLPVTVFKKVGQLLTLSLQNNMIDSLPTTVFSTLQDLKSLDLSNNSITMVTTDHLDNLPELGILRLDNNRLATVPDLREKMYIHSFTAANNFIDSVQEGYLHFNVQHLFDFELDLSGNRLTKLPSFAFNTTSTFSLALNFSRNPIQRIPPTSFDGMSYAEGLTHLSVDLSDTGLSELHGPVFYRFFAAAERAEVVVRLSSNHLSSLDPWIFFGLSQIDARSLTVHLDQNPWSCDCHLREFKQWVGQLRGDIQVTLLGMICEYPLGYAGQDALNLKESDLRCHRPIFKQPVVSILSRVAEKIQLECDVIGVPEPETYWVTPNYSLIYPNIEDSASENVTVGDNGTLIIQSLQSGLEGVYTCVATNSEGTAVSFRFVKLENAEPTPTPTPTVNSGDTGGCRNTTLLVTRDDGEGVTSTMPKVLVLIGGMVIGVLATVAFLVIIFIVHRRCKLSRRSRNHANKSCQGNTMAFSTLEKLAVRNESRPRETPPPSPSGQVNTAVVAIVDERYTPGTLHRERERERNYEDVDEFQKSDTESEHTYLSPANSATENVYEALSY
ncbi:carboxypeptidase N subunit 2-like [Ptychodera flava]|uniref:carboxypeptidase N subunit 2-like n=1 Tax=Ptychodera flava TaxID=63121 RepID=UPI00396A6D2E